MKSWLLLHPLWLAMVVECCGLFSPIVRGQDSVPTDVPGRPHHRIRFCGFGGNRELLEKLQSYWPNLEYCQAYGGNQIQSIRKLADAARALDIVFSSQACAPVFPAGYLEQHQCWARDFLNRTPQELGSNHPVADYCHRATVDALKQNLTITLRNCGARSFTMVDFVWPWTGGLWGFSEADVAAYRAALKGADGGLTIVDEHGERMLSFWDYFAELSGLRFQPGDVGYADWDHFRPVRPQEMGDKPADAQRRNAFLFGGLFHYCWLRYAQECGVHAKSLGGELQASLNPENFGNGTDILTWGRLKTTGEPWLEEWGNPWIAIAGYHNYAYFLRAYRASGKRLGLIGETGAAGGHPDSGFGPARPHYWDPNSNYAITWALGAAGQFDDREEDYFYASFTQTTDPAGPHFDCWRGYVRAADGFWQYALDAPRRPAASIISIVNRSVLHHADSSEYSLHQQYSLAPPLLDLHVDYQQAFCPLEPKLLSQANIVLFAPWDYPRAVARTIRDWLDGVPGRVLVTHSFAPTRPCKGLDCGPVPSLDEPEAAATFGLRGLTPTTVQSGQITAIAPAWQGVFSLPVGTKLTLAHPLVACEGKPLVKLGDANLVTQVTTERGGRIIYLNFTPPERYKTGANDTCQLLRACLEAIVHQQHIRPQAEGSARWACARYDLSRGHAFLLLDNGAVGKPRFTEETTDMEPAEQLSVLLEPNRFYTVYDVLGQTVAQQLADNSGRLPMYLSGRNLRLLYVIPEDQAPSIAFTDCERRDGRPRHKLPARLYSHRGGRIVLGGLPEKAVVLLNGNAAPYLEPIRNGTTSIPVGPGEHTIEIHEKEKKDRKP